MITDDTYITSPSGYGTDPRLRWQNMLSLVFILLTLACLFTPSLVWLRKLSPYVLYIMAGFLVTGISAFVLHYPRVMTVSLLCCMILCLHIKASSNKNLRLAAVTSDPSIHIAHISLGNVEAGYEAVSRYLLDTGSDLLSFQELTPDWDAHLTQSLSAGYPYIRTVARIDQYGMGLFSRRPFDEVDTFYFHDIPNLVGSITLENNIRCHIVSVQPAPPVSQAAFETIRQHLDSVSAHIIALGDRVVVAGDFHLPPWSAEVQRFKTAAQLQDCRRDIQPRHPDGSVSLPRIPVEHILFGRAYECISFSELGHSAIGRIGVMGGYQLKKDL